MPEIRIIVTPQEHKQLKQLKKGRTWKEMLFESKKV
jgi:hypothetical protein